MERAFQRVCLGTGRSIWGVGERERDGKDGMGGVDEKGKGTTTGGKDGKTSLSLATFLTYKNTGGGLEVVRNETPTTTNERLAIRGTASLCGPASSNADNRAVRVHEEQQSQYNTCDGDGDGHWQPHAHALYGPPIAAANEDQQDQQAFLTMVPLPPSAPVLRVPLLLAFLVPRVEAFIGNMMRRGGVVVCM